MEREIEVEIIHTSDASKITLGSRPVLIRGLPIGPCAWLWNDIEYLKSRVSGDKRVTVHVCSTTDMNFLKKNFLYKTLSFHAFLDRCASKEKLADHFLCDEEKYYLRALGDDPRKEAALFEKHFPELAPDVHIPNIFFKERLFSTVLRGGSAGVRLWTHYDIMDNILMQIVGRKTVVLFDPSDAPFLYLNGDKSDVVDVDEPDLIQYPLFAYAKRYRARMVPGDILYIPALWFHNVVAEDFSLAVNAFWRSTAIRDDYYDAKDVYGNSDLLPAQRAFQSVEKAMKQLEDLPERYRHFYAFRCMETIRKKFQLPRDLLVTSDSSFDSPVVGEYPSGISRLENTCAGARIYKHVTAAGGPSRTTLYSFVPPSPNQSFTDVTATGKNQSFARGKPALNVAPDPYCYPAPSPISGSAVGTYTPPGSVQGRSYSPLSYITAQPAGLVSPYSPFVGSMHSNPGDGVHTYSDHETTGFATSPAAKLSAMATGTMQQRSTPVSVVGLSSNGSNAGLGRLTSTQQQGPSRQSHQPSRREKKVLRFVDPNTGKDSFDERTAELELPLQTETVESGGGDHCSELQQQPLAEYLASLRPSLGGVGKTKNFQQPAQYSFTPNSLSVVGDRGVENLVDSAENRNDEPVHLKEKGGGESGQSSRQSDIPIQEGTRKYSRDFMLEAAKFSKSNIMPNFPMMRWSSDDMAVVFRVSKKANSPKARLRRNERRRRVRAVASLSDYDLHRTTPSGRASTMRSSSDADLTGAEKTAVGFAAQLVDETGLKNEPKAGGKASRRQLKTQASSNYRRASVDESCCTRGGGAEL